MAVERLAVNLPLRVVEYTPTGFSKRYGERVGLKNSHSFSANALVEVQVASGSLPPSPDWYPAQYANVFAYDAEIIGGGRLRTTLLRLSEKPQFIFPPSDAKSYLEGRCVEVRSDRDWFYWTTEALLSHGLDWLREQKAFS